MVDYIPDFNTKMNLGQNGKYVHIQIHFNEIAIVRKKIECLNLKRKKENRNRKLGQPKYVRERKKYFW